MSAATQRVPIKALVVVTYLVMVATNFLANALPLNGNRTGEVSGAYQNLFTPAGLTFSIWSVIYLLLGLHVLYQLGCFRGSRPEDERIPLLNKVGLLFSMSSLANTAWVFAWHYGLIPLSALLILVILVCLILIANSVRVAELSTRERWLIGVPFSVYFGWTTVATVANITVLLVYLDWDGFGLADSTWAATMVIVAMVIGAVTTLRNRDVAYGLVLIWAYMGILLRQVSPDGLDGRYPVSSQPSSPRWWSSSPPRSPSCVGPRSRARVPAVTPCGWARTLPRLSQNDGYRTGESQDNWHLEGESCFSLVGRQPSPDRGGRVCDW